MSTVCTCKSCPPGGRAFTLAEFQSHVLSRRSATPLLSPRHARQIPNPSISSKIPSIPFRRLPDSSVQPSLPNAQHAAPPTPPASFPETPLSPMDGLVSELAAITLAEPVSASSQRNPLWEARAEFLGAQTPPLNTMEEIPAAEIRASLERIIGGGQRIRTKRATSILENIRQHATKAFDVFKLKLNTRQVRPVDIRELDEEYATLEGAFAKVSKIKAVKDEVDTTSPVLDNLKQIIDEAAALDNGPLSYDTSHHFKLPINDQDCIAQAVMFLGVVASVMMGVSRKAGNFILLMISLILRIVFVELKIGSTPETDRIIQQIPRSIPTVLNQFDFDHKITIYAVCPECHATYKPKIQSGTKSAIYPSHCSFVKLPGSDDPDATRCTAPLLNPDNKPVKTFHYYHFHDFLASLLSRPDIEHAMDLQSDKLAESLAQSDHGDGPSMIHGPFDAEFLRSFKGPDSDRPFVYRDGNEGRYFFTLHVDFFNPNGLRTRGATISYGIISMACLNLPIEIRYKPENMYLAGIIPGPVEPHEDHTNHYLQPLMEDLSISWHRGVKYSRTALHPTGRSSRSAVAACVCDLVAARKSAQLPNHNANIFCSVCQCYHSLEKGRVDIEQWVLHDDDVRRSKAEEYRNAKTFHARDELFKEHGVRWTPLWILPYWKPGVQLVVDPMHCILEGVIQYHMRQVLHLDWKTAEQKEKEKPAFYWDFAPIPPNEEGDWSENEKNSLPDIHRWLCNPLDDFENALEKLRKRLTNRHAKSLEHVANDIVPHPPGAPLKGTKQFYAEALVQWRKGFPLRDDSPTSKLATPAVLEFVQQVIHETSTPSWVQSVPKHFGAKATGTLKASEWRTLAEIYLPIALVLSWSDPTRYESIELQHYFKAVLDHTMALFTAARVACLRTTSPARIAAYEENMRRYVRDLPLLHPTASRRTNLHMALHIPEFLRQFGPVHSWWAFPFERLIGVLQRLPTNNMTGQEEATMLHAYLRAASLRRWVAQRDCPIAIQEIKLLFDRVYGSPTDINNEGRPCGHDGMAEHGSAVKIPSEISGLVPAGSKLHAHYKYQGINYSRASTHLGNSLIEYHLDAENPAVLGSIQYIFTDKDNQTFFLVRQQQPASPGTVNPFSPYPYFPARICSLALSLNLEKIEPQQVLTHYARFNIDTNSCVVLPLNKW